MEKFKKTVSRRMLVGYVLMLIIIAMNTVPRYFMNIDIEGVSGRTLEFGVGLMLGAEAVVIYLLFKYGRAMRDETKMRSLYISETDERNLLIRTKTGGLAIDVIMCVLVCAVPIAGILNEVVFFTLVATLVFVALLKATLKVYYKNKF
jgi:hypothetical protein